jgi:hypothetical protein
LAALGSGIFGCESRGRRAAAQNLDCLKQLTAVSNSRYTQILEVFRRQFWQDSRVYFVFAERRLVFFEAKAP